MKKNKKYAILIGLFSTLGIASIVPFAVLCSVSNQNDNSPNSISISTPKDTQSNVTIFEGQNLPTFVAKVNTNSTPDKIVKYQWYAVNNQEESSPIPNATSNSLNLQNYKMTYENPGNYSFYLEATNGIKSAKSSNYTLNVLKEQAVTFVTNSNHNNSSMTYNFSTSSTSSSNPNTTISIATLLYNGQSLLSEHASATYQWYQANNSDSLNINDISTATKIEGATGMAFDLSKYGNKYLGQTATYYFYLVATITIDNASFESISPQYIVNVSPDSSKITIVSSDNTISNIYVTQNQTGTLPTLTPTGNIIDNISKYTNPTYQWELNGKTISNQLNYQLTLDQISTSGNFTYTFTVSAYNQNNQKVTNTATFNVYVVNVSLSNVGSTTYPNYVKQSITSSTISFPYVLSLSTSRVYLAFPDQKIYPTFNLTPGTIQFNLANTNITSSSTISKWNIQYNYFWYCVNLANLNASSSTADYQNITDSNGNPSNSSTIMINTGTDPNLDTTQYINNGTLKAGITYVVFGGVEITITNSMGSFILQNQYNNGVVYTSGVRGKFSNNLFMSQFPLLLSIATNNIPLSFSNSQTTDSSNNGTADNPFVSSLNLITGLDSSLATNYETSFYINSQITFNNLSINTRYSLSGNTSAFTGNNGDANVYSELQTELVTNNLMDPVLNNKNLSINSIFTWAKVPFSYVPMNYSLTKNTSNSNLSTLTLSQLYNPIMYGLSLPLEQYRIKFFLNSSSDVNTSFSNIYSSVGNVQLQFPNSTIATQNLNNLLNNPMYDEAILYYYNQEYPQTYSPISLIYGGGSSAGSYINNGHILLLLNRYTGYLYKNQIQITDISFVPAGYTNSWQTTPLIAPSFLISFDISSSGGNAITFVYKSSDGSTNANYILPVGTNISFFLPIDVLKPNNVTIANNGTTTLKWSSIVSNWQSLNINFSVPKNTSQPNTWKSGYDFTFTSAYASWNNTAFNIGYHFNANGGISISSSYTTTNLNGNSNFSLLPSYNIVNSSSTSKS